MIVSVSAALLIGSALACCAFGFCLASTGLAPAITHALAAAATLVSLG